MKFASLIRLVVFFPCLLASFGVRCDAEATTTDPVQFGRPAFRVFTDKQGLPQNTINCMTVDARGYLWIGTQDGAAYWNGRAWTVVNMPHRTVSNDVTALVALRDGTMWFGTGTGLVRFQNGEWTTFTTRNSPLPNDTVNFLAETASPSGGSGIWIATSNGLARFESDRWTVFTSGNSSLPAGPIRAISETVSPAGRPVAWFGTTLGGLISLDGDRWTVFSSTNSGIPHNDVWTLLKTDEPEGQVLWVGTNGGGMARFVPSTSEWARFDTANSKLPSNVVKALAETVSPSGRRTLWIGTEGGGLVRRTDDRWTVLDTKNSPLLSNAVLGFCPTPSAGGLVMWTGTNGGGLAAIAEGLWTTLDSRNSGLPSNGVWSFLETRSEAGRPVYWMGTYGNGLVRYEAGQWRVFDTSNSGLPHNQVVALLEAVLDGKRLLWVGTDGGGLCTFDGKTWTTFNEKNSALPSDNIFCIRPTANAKGFWIGTARGLARFENGQWTVFQKTDGGLPSNRVFDVLETRSALGRPVLWAATFNGGLGRFEDGRWTVLTRHNSRLPNDQPLCLFETKSPAGERALWVGMFGGGVIRINPDNPGQPWFALSDATTPALPNNTVYQIREDARKRLYMMTNKGVVRLTPRAPTADNPAEYDTVLFTGDDGLPANEGNQGASMIDSQGRIWMGTVGGIGVFDPTESGDEHMPPPLYIERAWLNGKSLFSNRTAAPDPPPALAVPFTLRDAKFRYNEKNIVFEFALLARFKESETRYRTQLVGVDGEPSPWTADAKKEYTTLPAGSYTFRVWARDFAGAVFGPVEATFTVRPAPWLTWWAYSLYALIAVGGMYGGVRLRLRTLDRRNRLLEAGIAERTAELAQAVEQLRGAKDEIEKKNAETERKNRELALKNSELVESNKRADRIFSALAEALPGTVLDEKYRLDEKIGAGGFGAVYRGMHLAMKRPIAVKVFKPIPGNDSAEALDRFQLEAVSSSRINHPNAVAVLDSGISSEGIAYLVMELLEGVPLSRELNDERVVSVERCAHIVGSVCDVLAQAHAMGVIHRDIKPENIFLHRDANREIVKVLDFGIAKILEADEITGGKPLTKTGGIIGTPVYMAPERFEGKPYDGRSDVYSLAVTAYEMLCGQVPFKTSTNSFIELVQQHLFASPRPPSAVNPNIPPAVESVILEALAKDPNQRPTANTFGNAFRQAVRAGGETGEIPCPTSDGRRILATIDSLPTVAAAVQPFDSESDVWNLKATVSAENVLDTNPQRIEGAETVVSRLEEVASLAPVTESRGRRVQDLFFTAVKLAPAERGVFLDETCADQPSLRRRLEALLEAEDTREKTHSFDGEEGISTP